MQYWSKMFVQPVSLQPSIVRFIRNFVTTGCVVLGMSGCKDLVGTADLPSFILDPAAVKSEAGAISVYRGVLSDFTKIYGGAIVNQDNFIAITGLLTDELTRGNPTPDRNPFPGTFLERVDARLLFADDPVTDGSNKQFYTRLNNIRVRSHETRGIIRKYAELAPPALYGHLLAIEATVITMLAELYCSGIPLTTVDFEQDYTVKAGLTTAEVYRQALILFDSAAGYAADSTRILNFIRLGRARVLLGLGRIDDARDAVTLVPTDFEYNMTVLNSVPAFEKYVIQTSKDMYGDAEGLNGLTFPNDPRTQRLELTNVKSPVTIERGITARLIEAEALLLNRDGGWLRTLNALRTTCLSSDNCPAPAPAGTGGISGLPPLDDPADGVPLTDTVALRKRLDMIFAERGYWLFLTGHRQGDLRRSIRNNGRLQQSVYPIGRYLASSYGTYVNLPVPSEEQQYNPLYRGCYDRNA